jgi:hypothetical protein
MKIYKTLYLHFINYKLPRIWSNNYSPLGILLTKQIMSGLFLVMFSSIIIIYPVDCSLIEEDFIIPILDHFFINVINTYPSSRSFALDVLVFVSTHGLEASYTAFDELGNQILEYNSYIVPIYPSTSLKSFILNEGLFSANFRCTVAFPHPDKYVITNIEILNILYL